MTTACLTYTTVGSPSGTGTTTTRTTATTPAAAATAATEEEEATTTLTFKPPRLATAKRSIVCAQKNLV